MTCKKKKEKKKDVKCLCFVLNVYFYENLNIMCLSVSSMFVNTCTSVYAKHPGKHMDT